MSKDETIYKVLYANIQENDLYLDIVNNMIDYNPIQNNSNGYHSVLETVVQINSQELSYNIKSTLAHELSHRVIDKVFKNDFKPYINSEDLSKYVNCIHQLQRNIQNYCEDGLLKSTDNDLYIYTYLSSYQAGKYMINEISTGHIANKCIVSSINTILAVYESYSSEQEHAEIIVRYPGIVADECYNDPTVKMLFKPLADYYHNTVEKHIDEYIKQHDTSITCPHMTLLQEFDNLFV